jgi:hypothetical protein
VPASTEKFDVQRNRVGLDLVASYVAQTPQLKFISHKACALHKTKEFWADNARWMPLLRQMFGAFIGAYRAKTLMKEDCYHES